MGVDDVFVTDEEYMRCGYDNSENTHRVINFLQKLSIRYADMFRERKYINDWTVDGVKCSYLKVGAPGWVQCRIKIKISLEFYPDDPVLPPRLEEDEWNQS